jgi:uncharacterized membrane protein
MADKTVYVKTGFSLAQIGFLIAIVMGAIKLVVPASAPYPWFDWNPFVISVGTPIFWGLFGGVILMLLIAGIIGLGALIVLGFTALIEGNPYKRRMKREQKERAARLKSEQASQKEKQKADRQKATLVK